MLNEKNIPWTERYRPNRVDGIVGDFRNKIKQYLLNSENMPHFLFYSTAPGTGKTSLAKAIIHELDCDALVINSSDDRKIETVREKVKKFCETKSSKIGKRRCVFLDEIDGMTRLSQEALRNTMETYQKNAFFILTANRVNKVIEPLQSRCQVIAFNYPNKLEVKNYLKMICLNESIKFTEEGLDKLIEMNYPSIRNCVLAIQDLWIQKLDVSVDTVQPANKIFEIFWQRIKERDWKGIKQAVMEGTVDARDLNYYFWEQSLKEENIKIIQITCRNERDISLGADTKVILVTSLIEMCK